MSAYVVIRFPSQGTLIGEAVARHPGSTVTCVMSGQHEHDGRPIVDHLALVEGLPDAEVASLLLAWKHQYGEAPQALGGPFALRLPVSLDADHTATVSLCLRLGQLLPDMAQRLHGGTMELWARCADRAEAERQRARLDRSMLGLPQVSVSVEEPSGRDRDCWELLRAAADDLILDCRPLAA